MLTIEKIKEIAQNDDNVIVSGHAAQRLRNRGIKYDDVIEAVSRGEIIEDYPDDYPFPSCLLLGTSLAGLPLHVVCGSDGEYLWIITAYYPSGDKWQNDFKTRRA